VSSFTAEPPAGIPEALARARAARIRHLQYALSFDIPRSARARVRGRAVLTFRLDRADEPLVLDFAAPVGAVHRCTVNGSPETPIHRNGHLVVPAALLRPGDNSLQVEFDPHDAPMNRRDDYVYTVLVPARAHELFPCFDQPDLKASFALTLKIPDDWEAVGNAPERGRRLDTGIGGGAACVVSFEDTDPLPTYLFAFAAGRFVVETTFRSGRMIRMFHHEPDDASIDRNRRAIIDQHVAALAWLEDYTGIPYPFAKLDLVLLPAFQFGGMEHAGAIFYNATSLLLESSATRQQELARASLIAHETAHMWFGNLVTMRWFGDVWMKEVFANFMAAKIVNPAFPDLDHELRFLHTHYPAAYDVDRTAGSNPIRQPLDNLADAGSLYGAIIYLKAPIVMRQLELQIGASALRDGVREYLRRYAFGNADWTDLLAVLAHRASGDLHAWSRDWLDVAGRPVMATDIACDGGRIDRLVLRRLPQDTIDAVWPQHLEVALGYGSAVEHVACAVHGDTTIDARGRPTPDYVLLNGRGLGYGEFHLDPASRAWLLRNLPSIADPLTRGSAWLTLWDAMLCHELPPDACLALAVSALPLETNELNSQRVLAYVERLFWTFLTASEREKAAPSLERTLRACLVAAETPQRKAAWFATVRAVAFTPTSVDWLAALWRGEAAIDGLPLGDAERLAVVQELAVRDARGSDEMVRAQIERTARTERGEALRFVAPALSADESAREDFFNSLRDVANRRREPWVVDGLRWLHHPLRQSTSLRFVRPGLALLDEVKRTGDIFLPKRWTDATLGGHSSPEAAGVVREFLDSRPAGYPASLRRIVLASADHLFRAARGR
jgi:aminopeptidase N